MIIADQSTQSLVVPGGEVGRGTECFGTVWYPGRHATRRTVNHTGSERSFTSRCTQRVRGQIVYGYGCEKMRTVTDGMDRPVIVYIGSEDTVGPPDTVPQKDAAVDPPAEGYC